MSVHDRQEYPIKFWRDETGHGSDTEVDNNEAYISLVTLLRFATFIKEHWLELTKCSLEEVSLTS